MPRYEVVTHVTVELAGATPEEAAALFKRECLSNANAPTVLRDLAVWPSGNNSAPEAVSQSIQHQLADFFAAVGRQAANEEEAFRAEVEVILARSSPTGASISSLLVSESSAERLEADESEHGGGAMSERRLRPWQ